MGIANVDKNSICGNQISAIPYYGYHFVRWSDGNTENPRILELTQDTIFTAEFAINQYSITTTSSHAERGTTQGDTTVNYLEGVTISATANYGYHFAYWNDYNYENPRRVQITEDKNYIAYFDKNVYYITKKYNSNQGYVNGSSAGEYLDNITLTAEPNYGYHFVRWADGNTDNPRHFVLTQDTTFTAEFAQTYSGQCGDNLYWSYKNSSLTISGFGDMYNNCPWGLFENEIQSVVLPNGITHIGNRAFSNCTGLSEIAIPNTVTSIGNYTFYGCSSLTSVTIPNSVTSIGDAAFYNCDSLTYVSLSQNVATIEESTFSDCEKLGTVILGSGLKEIEYNAFKGCKKLYDIYCYSPEPPIAEESSFTNYNVNLYVPCESLRDYQMDMLFGSFKYIQCISSEDVSTEDNIVVTPGTNDVTITWPTEDDADTYSIVITKDGEVFCTLTFNSNGQLVSIAFAPGRQDSHPTQYAEAAANGYRFTVTGLDESTKYAYNLDVNDNSGKTIKSYEGVFTTQSTTAVDEIQSTTNNVEKIFLDGQLLIIRDGKTYNAQGAAL